jgi:hypothetical protein
MVYSFGTFEVDSSMRSGSIDVGSVSAFDKLSALGIVSVRGKVSVGCCATTVETIKKLIASKIILGVDFRCIPGFLMKSKLKGFIKTFC